MFHLTYGYGTLRHSSGEGDALVDMPHDETGRVLTLPLLVLNLASDHPVHAGVCYYVEPGRRVVWRPPAVPDSPYFWFPPGSFRHGNASHGIATGARKGRHVRPACSTRASPCTSPGSRQRSETGSNGWARGTAGN
jgi:hypothetical protein